MWTSPLPCRIAALSINDGRREGFFMKTRIQSWVILLAAVVLSACSAAPGPGDNPEPVGKTKEAVTNPGLGPALGGASLFGGLVALVSHNIAEEILTPPFAAIVVGGQAQFTASTTATSWTVANPTIASVNATGLVTGLKAGTTTVTAHFVGTGVASTSLPATLTVEPAPVSVAIKPATSTIPVKGVEVLSAEDFYSSGPPIEALICTWTSSNPKVATVDDVGIVKGVAPGTVTITAIDCVTLDPLPSEDTKLTGTATVTVGSPTVDAGVDSGTDSSLDAEADADTGVDAGTDAGLCTALNLTSAPIVNATSSNSNPPAMMGGPIVPGQYVLQSIALYLPAGTSGSTPPTQQVIQVSATSILSDLLEYGDPSAGYPDPSDGGDIFGEFVVDWDYTTSGPSTMNYTYVCGASGTGSNGYTASPTSLVLSYTLQTGTEVYTYTLSP
jgi:hypothetical protein